MRINPAQTFLDWHMHQRADDLCWLVRYPELRQAHKTVAIVNSCTCPEPGAEDQHGNEICICCNGLILQERPSAGTPGP